MAGDEGKEGNTDLIMQGPGVHVRWFKFYYKCSRERLYFIKNVIGRCTILLKSTKVVDLVKSKLSYAFYYD